MIVGGCSVPTEAWYQRGVSFKIAVRDCEECRYKAMKYSSVWFSEVKLLNQCMQLKGYTRWEVSMIWIHSTYKVCTRTSMFDSWYNVAGM